MTEEERQRQMDFILSQQAQFAANQTKAEERIARLETIVVHMHEEEGARRDEMSALFKEVDEKIAALVDSQIRTEESIRNLTAVVDRYFEGRDGKS